MINEMATLLNEHSIKFYTLMLGVTGFIGSKLKIRADKQKEEKNRLVDRVTSLEKKVESIDNKIDSYAENQIRTDQKLDKIFDIVSDLQIQTAVNRDRLDR
ncbi:hypothetical protein KUA24_105 [Vibrio phage HNL01]|nr:hypothetical protein KUA24_105 [Vibrio phage HNL01]